MTFIDNAMLALITVALLVVATVAELGFALWLLIRSMDVAAFESRRASQVAGSNAY